MFIMAKEIIEDMFRSKNVDEIVKDWETSNKYICKCCGVAPRMHPKNYAIWYCLRCNIITDALDYYFTRKEGGMYNVH